jgi:SH3 domain protein
MSSRATIISSSTIRTNGLVLLLAGVLLLRPALLHADYVTESLRVELRSGGSSEHRIIDFVKAGTQIEVLLAGEEFTQIRTANGSEGWIATQYVVADPPSKDLLRQSQARIDQLTANLEQATAGTGNVFAELEGAKNQVTTLTEQLTSTRTELDRIRRISANSIEAEQKVLNLEELNGLLRDELKTLSAERQRLEDNLEQRWMLIGAGLILGGLILGALIKSRPRRSAWT